MVNYPAIVCFFLSSDNDSVVGRRLKVILLLRLFVFTANPGRVHSATVKSTDAIKSTVMVEWYERNICRGKEVSQWINKPGKPGMPPVTLWSEIINFFNQYVIIYFFFLYSFIYLFICFQMSSGHLSDIDVFVLWCGCNSGWGERAVWAQSRAGESYKQRHQCSRWCSATCSRKGKCHLMPLLTKIETLCCHCHDETSVELPGQVVQFVLDVWGLLFSSINGV